MDYVKYFFLNIYYKVNKNTGFINTFAYAGSLKVKVSLHALEINVAKRLCQVHYFAK